MEVTGTSQSESGLLLRVAMKHPREAFMNQGAIDRQWQALGYTAPPDFARACDEFDRLMQLLRAAGTDVELLPAAVSTGLDSLYVRDASIATDRGLVICAMGKELRAGEPPAQAEALASGGATILGRISPPGTVEGGDVAWLDRRTLAVGRGYRTNDEGIRQLRELLRDTLEQLVVVPLPHWRGPGDVMHLMSLISPVGPGIAVVYSPLLPVAFRTLLVDRGFTLVEVPDDEFETMGCNVLAVGPRRVVTLQGNPRTRSRLEAAGFEVVEYDGTEISVKGAGGPTCLTRPLLRSE